MLSSPSAPERQAGCKVQSPPSPPSLSPPPLQHSALFSRRSRRTLQVALLLAESFVAANHDIDEGDGLSDEVLHLNWFLFCFILDIDDDTKA
jgi:hypothetical protein